MSPKPSSPGTPPRLLYPSVLQPGKGYPLWMPECLLYRWKNGVFTGAEKIELCPTLEASPCMMIVKGRRRAMGENRCWFAGPSVRNGSKPAIGRQFHCPPDADRRDRGGIWPTCVRDRSRPQSSGGIRCLSRAVRAKRPQDYSRSRINETTLPIMVHSSVRGMSSYSSFSGLRYFWLP